MVVVVAEEAVRLVDQLLSPHGVHGLEHRCRLEYERRHVVAVAGEFVLVGGVREIGTVPDQVVEVLCIVSDPFCILDDGRVLEDERQIARVHRGVNHQ